jgi:hypothetical protein
VTVAPAGTDKINGTNTALTLPQGQHHFAHFTLLNSAATHWVAAESYAPSQGTWTGFGDFGGNIPCTNPGPTLRYAALFGSTFASSADTREYRMPSARTVRNLTVSYPTVIPSGETVIVTLRVNGALTALTCTTAAGGSFCEDLTHGVKVAQGDEVMWQISCGGGTNTVQSILLNAEFQ